MLVSTMTLEEIRREIEKDFPILRRKIGYVVHDLERELSKDIRKKGFVQFYDYLSKYKNQWIYRVEIIKKEPLVSCMLVYHNGRGHAAIEMTQDEEIIYFTGHFFERYNERCKLGLKSIYDIIRMYMNENNFCDFQELEEVAEGIVKIFCLIPSGIMLGMYNKPLSLIKANTFLTNDMLGKSQNEMKTLIINELEKYKLSSGNLY
jgi:hypothetical protein